ncbi:MAG: FxLYD domain-containing protein [Gemmatimonadaceae bacterium]
MAVFVKILPAAALLVAAATSLRAQETKPAAGAATAAAAPACDAAQPSSGNSVRANLSLQMALKDQKTNPAASAKNLAATVKLLESEKAGDPSSTYVLGSALSLWMNQPNVGFSPKRSLLGFTTNPDATIDLPSAVDSLFKIVETAKPSCAYYTSYWRGGQQVFLDLVNGAIAALNAGKLDSATYYATQANRLYSGSPYPSMVLGNIASKNSNNDDAIKYWKLSATSAGADTSYRDVERQVLGNIASVYMTTARDPKAAKPAQVEAAKQAATIYTQLIAIPGTKGSYLSGGRQNLQAALLIAGDTAGVVKSYSDMLANPGAHDYQDLLNAAVSAARANRIPDAIKLFEGVLALNPYNRDALFNLAVEYLAVQQNEKVAPIVQRLVAVDPGNPENYLLAARAYVDLGKAKKGAAAVAYNDSTVTWYNKGSKLPVDVTFTEFTPGEKQLDIAGTLLDRRDKAVASEEPTTTTAAARAARVKAAAAKLATMPAKAVTLKFEALDKAGAVLGSQTVTTEALQPGKSAPFKVSITAPNAIAYRYTYQ